MAALVGVQGDARPDPVAVERRRDPSAGEYIYAVRQFAGEGYERAFVPASARALLARFDSRSRHYEIVHSSRYHDGGRSGAAVAAERGRKPARGTLLPG